MTVAVRWQRVEGALVALASLAVWALTQGALPLWVSGLVLVAPDLAMIAYLAGPRIGAFSYNAVHLYAGGLVVAVMGVATGATALIPAGALWMLHVGADRALGYGLKSPAGFHDTHLGRIGRKDAP